MFFVPNPINNPEWDAESMVQFGPRGDEWPMFAHFGSTAYVVSVLLFDSGQFEIFQISRLASVLEFIPTCCGKSLFDSLSVHCTL